MVESKGTSGATKETRGRKDKRGDNIRKEKQRSEKEKVVENCNQREGKGKKNTKVDLTRNSPLVSPLGRGAMSQVRHE